MFLRFCKILVNPTQFLENELSLENNWTCLSDYIEPWHENAPIGTEPCYPRMTVPLTLLLTLLRRPGKVLDSLLGLPLGGQQSVQVFSSFSILLFSVFDHFSVCSGLCAGEVSSIRPIWPGQADHSRRPAWLTIPADLTTDQVRSDQTESARVGLLWLCRAARLVILGESFGRNDFRLRTALTKKLELKKQKKTPKRRR